jgi:hypothetical protein
MNLTKFAVANSVVDDDWWVFVTSNFTT